MQVLLMGKRYSRMVGIWTMKYVTYWYGRCFTVFSNSALDALDFCGMVFERFYKNWMYCSTNLT